MESRARYLAIACALVVGLSVGIVLAPGVGQLVAGVQTASAAPFAQTQTAADVSPSVMGVFDCTPTEVGVFPERIHVRCSTAAAGSIYYFAYRTTDTASTGRFLSVLSTAFVAGKHVYIAYEGSGTNNPAGCLVSDCRAIYHAVMH